MSSKVHFPSQNQTQSTQQRAIFFFFFFFGWQRVKLSQQIQSITSNVVHSITRRRKLNYPSKRMYTWMKFNHEFSITQNNIATHIDTRTHEPSPQLSLTLLKRVLERKNSSKVVEGSTVESSNLSPFTAKTRLFLVSLSTAIS